jgi:hypothetical protein
MGVGGKGNCWSLLPEMENIAVLVEFIFIEV